MSYIVMNFAPAALEREMAASYCSLSESTFEKAVREKKAPQPRQLADRRVAWLRAELDAWLHACPISEQAPPENTGAKKPRAPKRRADEEKPRRTKRRAGAELDAWMQARTAASSPAHTTQ